VIPDRIEAGTYLLMGAVTRGEVTVVGAEEKHMESFLAHLRNSGAKVYIDKGRITVAQGKKYLPTPIITAPYPGFPTDLQAQWMVYMLTIPGISLIEETIFENRFMHVPELLRMGAVIRLKGSKAWVEGGKKLSGAEVMATDLRASVALVMAGLIAEGETWVLRLYHLERGYENLEGKLLSLGGKVSVEERDATHPLLQNIK
jgi:UDP-N-acetylglucosamine 1-carboxyvinyltransferase